VVIVIITIIITIIINIITIIITIITITITIITINTKITKQYYAHNKHIITKTTNNSKQTIQQY